MTTVEKSSAPDLKETGHTSDHHEEKDRFFLGIRWVDIAALPVALLGLAIFFGTMAAITVFDSARLISTSRMNHDCW